jgi:lambda repressor-like predicted transcriptional regulator
MVPQKPRRKRQAYGLSPSLDAMMATATEIQRLMAPGINADGSLKPEAIRALLKVKQVNLRDLAASIGKRDAYLHHVITRLVRDVWVENRIAEALGLDPDRIFARRRESSAA